MRFVSALTTEIEANMAAADLMAQIGERIEGDTIHMLAIFLSPHFAKQAGMFSERLREAFSPHALIGCTAEGVLDGAHEVERQPAAAVLAANLPGVHVSSFALHDLTMQSTHGDVQAFAETLAAPEQTRLYLLLADPFSTPIQAVLDAFNTYRPGVPVIGGMASGAVQPGGNALLLDDQVYANGAVGISLAGAFSVDVIVSQGCRPVGKPYRITAVQKNVIQGLDSQPPFTCVQAMVDELNDEDRDLLQNGLFIGRAINSKQDELGRGDFLIRSVIGVDADSGAIVIDEVLAEDEIIQFHVRDAETAEEDLDMMLAPQTFYDPPCGGFLFSCNGRGTRFFDYPDGDVTTIRRSLGILPLAGFFCAGEIGPIGGRNFLHGHTASMALFREE